MILLPSYTIIFNINTNANPQTEIAVSNTDHVKNVSFTVNPKYSLKIQNPVSLTCEKIILPEPIASVTNAKFVSVACSSGSTIPVVEMAATVAEPCAIRSKDETIQANNIGDILEPTNICSIVLPTPPSIKISLNEPPAPKISIIIPIGIIAEEALSITCFIVLLRRIPIEYIANNSEINIATGALPIKYTILSN